MKQDITLAIIFLILSGCAGQRVPEGGPVDSDPPQIISVYPAPNTINFSDNKVVIEFSEYVDRRSAEEAIFISPNIDDKEFDWSSTEMELTFNEALKKNTTYVITVGTDVKDVQAGNKMANAFTLSFSTGDKIDNGSIKGKVYDEKPDGVMIFSYRLNDINSDTLDPTYVKPDYITQTGTTGSFNLTNLAPGLYRLFAVRDEYRNLLYDPETDEAGTTDDVTISEKDTLVDNVKFIIAKEDTTPPRISSVSTLDKQHIMVQFSEEIDSSSVKFGSFTVTDTLFANPLKVREYFPLNGWNTFVVATDSQKTDELYLLNVDSVIDRNGFLINPTAKNKQFTGSSALDTFPPALISTTVKDTGTKILSNQLILFSFSDAIQKPLPDSMFKLFNMKDTSVIPISTHWISSASIAIQSDNALNINNNYAIQMRWKGIKDLFGNSCKDSVSKFKFSILDPEEFGSIEGSYNGFGGEVSTVIQAKNIADKNQKPLFVKTKQSGKFSLNLLPEGRYVLKAFEDKNNNMAHDAGKIFPFRHAEKFMFYGDTIRVRARWPVDGVMIKGN